MSRPVRLTILLLALALTAATTSFSSGETSSRETPSVEASARAVAQARAGTDVCAGVTGCSRVASVDVDGDGSADQVGVASRKLAGGGSITVRVRTATGHTLQTTGRDVVWFAKPFHAAAPLDGEPGAEIFVGDTMGANYEQFRVITYREGRLVTLEAPPAAWTKAGMSQATPRWGIDGSYSFSSGVVRTVSSQGTVTLTMKALERNASGTGHSGHVTSYRWHDGAWQNVSARSVGSASDRTAFASGGWHVPGVPRFA